VVITERPADVAADVIDVSVIVVTYRTPELTARCLRSIAAQTVGVSAEVIVVDNDAGAGTSDGLAALHPACRVLSPGTNLGFARGVNLAAAEARGRHLLLLNPDTEVVAGAVQELVRFADASPAHGLYGGRTVDGDGRLDPRSCWGFPTLWSTACFATGLSSAFKRHRWLDPESLGPWDRDTVRTVDVVTGCLCLVPRDAWRDLGGFDERFFLYGEDVDLALRARAAGYRPLLCPDATVIHDVGQASATQADKLVLLHRGKVTLLRKHWSVGRAALGVALLRVGVALRALAGSGSWRDLHRRRDEWVDGYPAHPEPGR
jgi:N-acetylglucosaminyl-diphospho-decaprenol L-rhamnosyltransferase